MSNGAYSRGAFHQALNIARHQPGSQQQEKRQDAYDLLAPVYGWFTEGFDMADLQEAKGLLAELA